MSNVELQELDIMIQALESNLMVFKMIQKEFERKKENTIPNNDGAEDFM